MPVEDRRFRFGLRTLLILIAVASVALGLALFPAQRYQQRKAKAEAMITSLGGAVTSGGWGDMPGPGTNLFSLLCGFGEPREVRWVVRLPGALVSSAQIRQLGECSWIGSLDLSNTQVGDEDMTAISQLAKLRDLRIANTRITDAGLATLKQLDHLYVLDVSGTAVTYRALADLEKSFAGSNFREQLALAKLKKSQDVDSRLVPVGYSSEVDMSPSPMIPTAGMVDIDSEAMGAVSTVTAEDIESFRMLKNLKDFRARGKSFPPGGLCFLADLKGLEHVAVLDTKVTTVYKDDLATIAQLPNLKELMLYGHELTDEDFAQLANADQIESLSIFGYRLTPQLLVHLRGLRGLRRLDVIFSNQPFGDSLIKPPTPEQLTAARESIKHLEAIPKLEQLHVMGNMMTNEVVAEFAKLKNLKLLVLTGSDCTQETVDRLQQELPGCKIEFRPK